MSVARVVVLVDLAVEVVAVLGHCVMGGVALEVAG